MSFFIKSRKRKVAAVSKNAASKPQDQKKKSKSLKNSKALSEEIESESDVDSSNEFTESRDKIYSSEEEEETAQQKKLRLAKHYLSKLEEEEAEKKADEESLKEAVASRLQHDISEQAGKLTKQVADQCSCPKEEDIKIFRGHSLPVTSVVISPDDKFVFTASKDCNICKWDLKTGLKVKTVKGGRKGTEDVHIGHTNHILCMTISSDGKFLAAGDMNNMVKLWNPEDCSFIHKFKGHRGPVTGVSFRKGGHTLYSCSTDRVVKVWNVDELAYVETLFGHNSPITGIDSLARDRAITSGGRDKSVHVWKITEDSQLLFHGHDAAIECVALINEGNFFTGADDSSLSLWSVLKKKPVTTVKAAHNDTGSFAGRENWITAVSALHYTDLVASGSKDGFVRLWKCGPDFKSLKELFKVPVKGFVNSLKFSSSGDFLVAGVGQEHRLGRWWRLKEARNGWCIIPLKSVAAPDT
ncbi:ribosomal RNA processing 9, small subunit (ssu) processome component, homolog [Plakobranchus ocellatus]|uniref:U3 small nucleolar RNA-interacting protein 2 n=1 Tax=Plakobranchus ocellatus TaxID=259542 RepID=A0AAV4BQG0_9GAST|nr:ribosomal RNA processing 9, small subunit (ssu) processome component, homolog [Plakobranchus ocellatus]